MDPAERTVLFVCVENACRSLMAEAMFNGDPPSGWRADSAGTEPARAPNPRTEGMLREIGLERPGHPPQLLTSEMMATSRVIVTMGCLDRASCPAKLKAIEVRDWALPDPAQLDDAGFRQVRDDLHARVKGLRLELVLADRRRAALHTRQ
jgi:arsenate reductase (thioredoxin)